MSPATLTFPTIKTDLVQFEGGLDQVTPPLRLKPGIPHEALNYECNVLGGFSRIAGYERLDGHAKPSTATYSIVQVESFATVPLVGDILASTITGSTGKVLAVVDEEEVAYLVIVLQGGIGFSTTEQVFVGPTLIGQATDVTAQISALLTAQYLNLAADYLRDFILSAPGAGPARGVFSMNLSNIHTVFVFKDNVGGTSCDLYKTTPAGWVQVPYVHEVEFTLGGTNVPLDGDLLTQGANTATILRVMLESGSWAAGTAVGRFIVDAPTPADFAAGVAMAGAVGVTLSGIQTPITMLPGGRFELQLSNFAGQLSSERIYGCDKANRCFEFDGVTLAPIRSPFIPDQPTHLTEHQKHLFISLGSSIAHSGIGTPFQWTALSGAAEYATGDTVTGFSVQPGAQNAPALLITGLSSMKMMYGAAAAGASPFQLVNYNAKAGAIEYSIQNMDRSYFVDVQGLTDLTRVQEFGNFARATLTFMVQPFMDETRSLIVESAIYRAKSQYRFFCSDGRGLFVTFQNGTFVGAMPIRFAHPITCCWTGILPNGNEVQYVGAANGMVYELERGSSFDGEAIDFSLAMNWDSKKSPRVLKDYRLAILEMQGNFYASVTFAYILGYGSPEYEQQSGLLYESNFRGAAQWDSGILWDAFVWDGFTGGPTECEMAGSAENFQVRLSGSADFMYAFSVSSLITHYIDRRVMR
jgi:hypothetical protein